MILFRLIFDTLLALAIAIALLVKVHGALGDFLFVIGLLVLLYNLRQLLFFIKLRRLSNAARARYK